MPKLIRVALWIAAVALLPCEQVFAIAVRSPCDRPFVFPGVDLNVVVLPYSQPSSLGATTPEVGTQLGQLVEFETLLAIAKFGSVGLIQTVGDPEDECTPEIVLGKLVGSEMLQPRHALIMIWGRIFESGSDLYLQTYLRFLRRDATENVEFVEGGRTLSGRLSSQSLALAPRKIALSELERIQQQYATANLLRATPNADAAFVRIPESGGPYSFGITDVRGDWVELAPMSATQNVLPRGWVLARAPTDGLSLRERMPELALVEGIAGYLSARVRNETRPLAAADAALSEYLERWRRGAFLAEQDTAASGMTLAVAIPEQLRGIMVLLRATGSSADSAAAHDHFKRAATLMPYSASARNLSAISGVSLALRERQPDRPPRQYLSDLLAAVNNDPGDREALDNLAELYDLVLTPPSGAPSRWSVPTADREALTQERDALRAVLRP